MIYGFLIQDKSLEGKYMGQSIMNIKQAGSEVC
jgi:hypothetical protein